MRLKQLAIVIDQGLNVLCGGYADETLSARAYRCRDTKPHWRKAMRVIDTVFFWQPEHCKESFVSERERRQLPVEYRDLQQVPAK